MAKAVFNLRYYVFVVSIACLRCKQLSNFGIPNSLENMHRVCVPNNCAMVPNPLTSCRPSSSVYALMTTFPNRELNDPTQTISEAKLLNAVVVQRLK